jgi:RTX calcium-binding nonapeptide repeat (4 copies)
MTNFVVTNLNDSGVGSLRNILAVANANPDADVITFAAGLSGGTLVLTSGELSITNDVTIDGDINGDNKADITISGNNASRIINQSGSTTDLILNSLMLTNGSGGAFNTGGAIHAIGGTLKISDTTISNSAAPVGGGIYTSSTKLNILNSLISGNSATYNGGGVAMFGSPAGSSLFQTTIVNNSSNRDGGGIAVSGASLSIVQSTITNNRAEADGGTTFQGGGVSITSSTVNFYNSVAAENTTGASSLKSDIFGSINFAQNNVFGSAPTISNPFSTFNQINVADVGLGTLGNHGGSTDTRNIVSPTSVLINSGYNGFATSTDANGAPRIDGGKIDIGATEYINTITVTNLNATGAGSLREAVNFANATVDPNHIVFAAGLNGSIALINSLVLSSNVSINGDTNGDGDADITLTDGGATGALIQVNSTGIVDLTSLNIANSTVDSGASAISNNQGNLTINYSVISGNTVTGTGAPGADATTILNTGGGFLTFIQTVLANNIEHAQAGRDGITPTTDGNGGNGTNGGNAAAILNSAGSTLSLSNSAVINGSAFGGNGGEGGFGFGAGFTGGGGGNGGNAAAGILNFGAFNGSEVTKSDLAGSLNATAGLAGLGRFGFIGGGSGVIGSYSNYNLSLAGSSGSLSAVPLGTHLVDTVSGIVAGTKFFGLAGSDLLTGDAGSALYGGAGNDILTNSYAAGTRMYGGLGNDTLRITRFDPNFNSGVWDGGTGVDTFDASGQTVLYGLNLNLSNGVNNAGGIIRSVENIIGTNNAALSDNLTGSSIANNIQGLAGNDTIEGGAGGDTLNGGANTAVGDTLSYVGSSVGVTVNIGTNTASGGDAAGDVISNFENLTGSAFQDFLSAGAGANTLRGGADNDTLNGGTGSDFIFGDAGQDTIIFGNGLLGDFDNINGGADRDLLDMSSTSNGAIWIDFGYNVISGPNTAAGVNLFTAAGEGRVVQMDSMIGTGFNDTMRGDAGSNFIDGGAGDDQLLSYSPYDTVTPYSSLGDVMLGGIGNDLLFSGTGNDYLDGGVGNDTIEVGGGTDTVVTGTGNDVVFFSPNCGTDTVTDFTGGAGVVDVLRLYGFGTAFDTAAEVIAASSQHSLDTWITLPGTTIILQNFTATSLVADDFVFV